MTGRPNPFEPWGDSGSRAGAIGGKHPGSLEAVALRGVAVEREPWPARDAHRGSSPPGETRRDEPCGARRRCSRPPWQRVGDRGMLGLLMRRGVRKCPKGLRALHSGEPARTSTSGALHESGVLRPGANPLSFRARDGASRSARTSGQLDGRPKPKRLGILAFARRLES